MGDLEDKLASLSGAAKPSELDTLNIDDKVIKLKAPLASNRLLAVELSNGDQNLSMTFEAMLCVVSINGAVETRATSRARIDALADRLGLVALEEVVAWHRDKQFPELKEALDEMIATGGTMEDAMKLAIEKRRAKSKNSQKIQ